MGHQIPLRIHVGIACIYLLLIPLPSWGQELIQEKSVSATPLAPSAERDYRPCLWTAQKKTSMCLRDRLNLIYELQPGELSGKGSRCQLTFEGEEDPLRFRCGRLRIAMKPRTPLRLYQQIAEAAEGEWEDFETYPDRVVGKLRVTPGTERNALFRIIFHPGILWADFDRLVRVITELR